MTELTIVRQLLNLLAGRLPEDPDWPALIALAGDTLTLGDLADRALRLVRPGQMSAEIEDLLTDIRERAVRRNRMLSAQLHELMPAMNGAGIVPMLIKGSARLVDSPGGESTRILADLDLLVPAEARGEASRRLRGLRYEVLTDPGDPRFPVVLGREQDAATIDLHTALRPDYLALDYGRLEPLAERIAIGGGHALRPSPTGQLILFIVHDQLHDGDYWRGLIDIRHVDDLRELVERGVDWQQLHSVFERGAVRRALEVQLRTLRELTGAAVPHAELGGMWSRGQCWRRALQLRWPLFRRPLTFLTLALDPPPRPPRRPAAMAAPDPARAGWGTRYFRPADGGKLAS